MRGRRVFTTSGRLRIDSNANVARSFLIRPRLLLLRFIDHSYASVISSSVRRKRPTDKSGQTASLHKKYFSSITIFKNIIFEGKNSQSCRRENVNGSGGILVEPGRCKKHFQSTSTSTQQRPEIPFCGSWLSKHATPVASDRAGYAARFSIVARAPCVRNVATKKTNTIHRSTARRTPPPQDARKRQ